MKRIFLFDCLDLYFEERLAMGISGRARTVLLSVFDHLNFGRTADLGDSAADFCLWNVRSTDGGVFAIINK